MKVEGRKALVLGAGRSGVASATFLAERGAKVALHDRKPLAEWPEKARSLNDSHGVATIDGDIPSMLLDQIDLVVISPGVPTGVVPARYVDRKDGEVIGEVELAYRFLKGRLVGITGSNGKTTTTSLVGEILRNAGIEVQVGGNIGTPLLSLTGSSSQAGWTVAELSSFQLETIVDLRPNVGICLNVTPNHMDRYELFTDYAAAKHRLFRNQDSSDVAILNADDEITSSWVKGLKAHTVLFSTVRELDEGLFLRGEELVSRSGGSEKVLAIRSEMKLRGVHNVQNVLAAMAAGLACGADPRSMRETVRDFNAVEHRLEFVATIAGVDFYNDSKATSVDATLKALEAIAGDTEGNIVLILGGLGKNAPYSPLAGLVQDRVRALVLIGEDAPNIEEQLGELSECIEAGSMAEAVRIAFGSAEEGDTVLLAPACASFDMYSGFEERGKDFKDEVALLGSSTAEKANG
ncbi:MAG: UDP-N-acetylmuramoyl-L-alanine--D-glutamate ligase [Acidobacteria bacterium]|nr:MAG: UDP-N-acetylmuramoyl-L-alanine--D-glutamate ligase [Acidobacteriota bacterium]REK02304.1 MAG: UDP-N-acetylmuramoyl-L-alanine--D-glutamate ligase [Acidobacteriota bacterium]REK13893.1 MAG: UDP-N-acetylmuramoyl-L-alanine--D-glutamate ligase [Acidobacteriota bacterium]REK41887.1 MAG: UDP-N-acetylmuramoyl-L-alanine--D-glutamate ligase [Acidobacteriota bacterium]